MSRALPISGEYPADWKGLSDRVWAEAGHRCVRCGHPYIKGVHGKGEWTPCDASCRHGGPVAILEGPGDLVPRFRGSAELYVREGLKCFAQWRIGTVHHFDGNKANCVWWNLMALCQRCHLKTQARVNPHIPYILEHSDWFKPYVAGFYSVKYEGREITRERAMADMVRLLSYERIA